MPGTKTLQAVAGGSRRGKQSGLNNPTRVTRITRVTQLGKRTPKFGIKPTDETFKLPFNQCKLVLSSKDLVKPGWVMKGEERVYYDNLYPETDKSDLCEEQDISAFKIGDKTLAPLEDSGTSDGNLLETCGQEVISKEATATHLASNFGSLRLETTLEEGISLIDLPPPSSPSDEECQVDTTMELIISPPSPFQDEEKSRVMESDRNLFPAEIKTREAEETETGEREETGTIEAGETENDGESNGNQVPVDEIYNRTKKPFKCLKCNKNYATKTTVSRHVAKAHKGRAKFTCNEENKLDSEEQKLEEQHEQNLVEHQEPNLMEQPEDKTEGKMQEKATVRCSEEADDEEYIMQVANEVMDYILDKM